MKLFPQQIFEKYSNIELHENPSSGSRVVPCGRTDGWTVMTKIIIIAFRNFAKSTENGEDGKPLRSHPTKFLHTYVHITYT